MNQHEPGSWPGPGSPADCADAIVELLAETPGTELSALRIACLLRGRGRSYRNQTIRAAAELAVRDGRLTSRLGARNAHLYRHDGGQEPNNQRDARPHALYRYYDAGGELLYVGIANDPFRRMAEHRQGKQWWQQVKHLTLEHFPNRKEALTAEREAIKTEHPRYNIQHNERAATVHAVVMHCEICGDPVLGDEGYLEVDSGAALRRRRVPPDPVAEYEIRAETLAHFLASPDIGWHCYHRRCDPDPERTTYWIGSDRLTTIEELLDWTAHLMEKDWIGCTNWATVLRTVRSGSGLLRIKDERWPRR